MRRDGWEGGLVPRQRAAGGEGVPRRLHRRIEGWNCAEIRHFWVMHFAASRFHRFATAASI